MEENTAEVIETEVADQAVGTAEQSEPTIEDRAKMMGWIPPDEFKGNPAKHVSAEDFVARAEKYMPVLKAQLRKYESEIHQDKEAIKAAKAELDALKQTMDRVIKVQDKIASEAYEKALKDIQAQKREAIREGDVDRVDALEKQQESLKKEDFVSPVQAPAEPQQKSIEEIIKTRPSFVQDWYNENKDWYHEGNPMAIMYADSIESYVISMGLKEGEAMKKITEEVMAKFPDLRKNKARSMPSVVADGGVPSRSVSSSKTKTYADLPKDAKEACEKYVKQGLGSKEKYVKLYFES